MRTAWTCSVFVHASTSRLGSHWHGTVDAWTRSVRLHVNLENLSQSVSLKKINVILFFHI
jgi:hypothetical protein